MMLDALFQFSSAQAFNTDGTDSTNIMDLGVANRRLGAGEALYVFINVTTVCASAAKSVTLRQSANSDMSTETDLATLVTLGATDAVGTKYIIPLPVTSITQRYIDLEYNGSGSGTGAVDAHLVLGPADEFEYPDGLTITG